MEYIGKKIEMLRRFLNISQKELANKLDINKHKMSNIEKGKVKEPDYNTLIKLTEFFNISIDDLLKKDTIELLEIINRKKK